MWWIDSKGNCYDKLTPIGPVSTMDDFEKTYRLLVEWSQKADVVREHRKKSPQAWLSLSVPPFPDITFSGEMAVHIGNSLNKIESLEEKYKQELDSAGKAYTVRKIIDIFNDANFITRASHLFGHFSKQKEIAENIKMINRDIERAPFGKEAIGLYKMGYRISYNGGSYLLVHNSY